MAKGSNRAKPDYITPEIFSELIEWIEDGNSVRKFDFKQHGIARSKFYVWLDTQATDEQRNQYARALETRCEVMFEECLQISDDVSNDIVIENDRPVIDGFAVQRARVMIDTRKWMLGKMNPKKYSDKLTIGGDADNPIVSTAVALTAEHQEKLSKQLAERYGIDPA